jgi:lipoic acid synthetase
MTLAPEGRKLLRVEQRNSVPVERKPEWTKAKVQMGPEFVGLKNLVKKEDLYTVCEEAGCPNIFERWEDKEATFLIGGSECTRRCDFCQIDTGKLSPGGHVRAHQGGPVRAGHAAAVRHRHRCGPG